MFVLGIMDLKGLGFVTILTRFNKAEDIGLT
jgi:hypothetical protein